MANASGLDLFFESWKKQVDASVRMMDAVVEATAKMRAAQLAAANEMRERAQALEKALADATSAQELWGAQWNWALASCGRSAAYWQSLFEAMNEANDTMARCLGENVKGCVAEPGEGEPPATSFAAIDEAYREMFKTSQKLLQYTAKAFQTSAAPASAEQDEAKKAA